jgi:hypothetical protein
MQGGCGRLRAGLSRSVASWWERRAGPFSSSTVDGCLRLVWGEGTPTLWPVISGPCRPEAEQYQPAPAPSGPAEVSAQYIDAGPAVCRPVVS